ncbi:endolysin [Burkholderia phage BCSR5]|nr:endolysin [Burkholderia phage BCSR5]
MAFQITAAQLAAFAPSLKQIELLPYVQAINAAAAKVGIDQSARRMRYFMAQSFFETKGYMKWDENLVYTTPQRLVDVWPSRFTMDKSITSKAYAPDFVNNPEKLANQVYMGRYGNVAPGDGWKFHGRGAFHLTFLNNYKTYGLWAYKDPQKFVNAPDDVNLIENKFMSAAWFWQNNSLGAIADADGFTKMTGIINGSTDTVPQRLPVLKTANTIFTW